MNKILAEIHESCAYIVYLFTPDCGYLGNPGSPMFMETITFSPFLKLTWIFHHFPLPLPKNMAFVCTKTRHLKDISIFYVRIALFFRREKK